MISQLNQHNKSSHQAYDTFINQLLDILLASKGQEERRLQVIHFMNRLFASVGLSSFLYGSVALGTYLPDGDIDVSVFCRDQLTPHEWTKRVKKALCSNSDRIKGVTFINAQVKIYKCLIDDVSIDVSGNQIGGLCTLCFLERMNQKFGKEDLLKKSIVLVKAWSYYEARILASHHGLLSTYAVTVLILFILNAFYDELETPLQVLIKFFEYFSDFDWDRYGIGIQGAFLLDTSNCTLPNHLPSSSSPNGDDASHHDSAAYQHHDITPAAHPHEQHATSTSSTNDSSNLTVKNPHTTDPTLIQHNFVCTDEFLKECVERYGISTDRPFQRKFFNILDPARADNNLGRSVSRSNFLRIRKVFKKGYNTLRQILDDNEPSQILTTFFKHSWTRNISNFPVKNGKNGHHREVVTDMKKRNLLFQRKLEDFESHLDAAKEHLRMAQQNTVNATFPLGSPGAPGMILANGADAIGAPLVHHHHLNGTMHPSPAPAPSIANGGTKQKFSAKQKQKYGGKSGLAHNTGGDTSSTSGDKNAHGSNRPKKWKSQRYAASQQQGNEAASQNSAKKGDSKQGGGQSRRKNKKAANGSSAPHTATSTPASKKTSKTRSRPQSGVKKPAEDPPVEVPLDGGGYVLSLADLVKTAKRKKKQKTPKTPRKKTGEGDGDSSIENSPSLNESQDGDETTVNGGVLVEGS